MSLINKTQNRKNHNVVFIKRILPLIAYFKEFGTIANIKQNAEYEVDGEMIKIGWLIANLRQEKRKGLLNEEDVFLLEYFGMDWGDVLNQHLEVLEDYYINNKTLADLTQYSGEYKYKDKIINLGTIVTYIRLSNKLTEEQIANLEEKGLKVAPKSIESVIEPFVAYYKKYGTIANIKVDESFTIGNKVYNIGRKINYFRTKYHKGQLSQEYIDKLNEMGMCWSKRKQEENIIEL